MLSNVSWSEYGEIIAVVLVIYYLIVGIGYFREELKKVLTGKLPKTPNSKKTENSFKETDLSLEELEAVVQDLRYAIFDRAGKEVGKEELLNLLKGRLKGYAGLQRPAYRVAINNYIIANAKELCGVLFNKHELNSAWDSL
jgi:hypothetical protein